MKPRFLIIPVLIMIITGGFFSNFLEKHDFKEPDDKEWQLAQDHTIDPFSDVWSIDCQAKIEGFWTEEEEGRGKGLRLPPMPLIYSEYTCEVWVFLPDKYENETWRWNFLSGYDELKIKKNTQVIVNINENRSVDNPQADDHHSKTLSHTIPDPDRNAEYEICGKSFFECCPERQLDPPWGGWEEAPGKSSCEVVISLNLNNFGW